MRAVFLDLDGTLHCSEAGFHPQDLQTLRHLGEQDVLRVIVTGRSLYATRKLLDADFPIDYLIFSSGAGVFNWQSQQLLASHHLTAEQIETIVACCRHLEVDYMLQAAVPENHFFWYEQHSITNADFARRLFVYPGLGQPLAVLPQQCSQALVIARPEDVSHLQACLLQQLPTLSHIRATSPLDKVSAWLEIFPAHVSKAQAAARLCQELGIQTYMAMGNDHNDTDLLAWAQHSFVVSDAPELLTCLYTVVPPPHQAGFSEAMRLWA